MSLTRSRLLVLLRKPVLLLGAIRTPKIFCQPRTKTTNENPPLQRQNAGVNPHH